jgi:hypothetical protein
VKKVLLLKQESYCAILHKKTLCEAFSAYLGPNLSQQLHYFSLMKPALQIFC